MVRRHTLLVSVVFVAVLVGGVATPAAATQTDDQPEPSLTVTVDGDGDARVAVVYTYDLTNGSRQAAFDDLRTNETAQAVFEDQFTDDWQSLATNTENRTGREMAVQNSSIAFSRTNSTGAVTVSLTWEGLAAAEDGMVTLSEPFANGYTPDRPLVVVLPDAYQLTSVSPGPTNASAGRLVYEAGSDLDGLSIVATTNAGANTTPDPSPTATPLGTSDGSGPGFGVVGAVVAVLAVALLARRRE